MTLGISPLRGADSARIARLLKDQADLHRSNKELRSTPPSDIRDSLLANGGGLECIGKKLLELHGVYQQVKRYIPK